MGKDPHDGTSLNITGGGLLDGLTGDLKGMKVGIPADCFGSGLDPEVGRVFWVWRRFSRAAVPRWRVPTAHYGVCGAHVLYPGLGGSQLQPVSL